MMPSLSDLLEREGRTVDLEPDSFERLIRRRDRKRRNQRIAAGVVGIAVFVAAVWFVTSAGPTGRTRTPVVPGGAGPTVTGPTGSPDGPLSSAGLPPEGVEPSSPEIETLVAAGDINTPGPTDKRVLRLLRTGAKAGVSLQDVVRLLRSAAFGSLAPSEIYGPAGVETSAVYDAIIQQLAADPEALKVAVRLQNKLDERGVLRNYPERLFELLPELEDVALGLLREAIGPVQTDPETGLPLRQAPAEALLKLGLQPFLKQYPHLLQFLPPQYAAGVPGYGVETLFTPGGAAGQALLAAQDRHEKFT
jgi:hypothetical protein